MLALVFSTGLHWAALQTVAWSTMLAVNLKTETFSEAVSKTFDGDHPCPLCKAIRAGKKAEQKSESTTPNLKLEFPPITENFVLVAPSAFQHFSTVNIFAESVSQPPPLPPPRLSPV